MLKKNKNHVKIKNASGYPPHKAAQPKLAERPITLITVATDQV
jgi:hypothetical protein